MKDIITSQQSLGQFLRATRERLTPEQVGLLSYGRRRTPGLRREEVAQLANVGISWYTSIEQGKDVHPSRQVLESLASALRLSDDERRYLFILSKSDETDNLKIYKEISSGLEKTVFALEPHPAYIMDKYWDVLSWNRGAEYIFEFPPYSTGINPKPNILHHCLSDSLKQENDPAWEERIKVMIARFRADCARYPQDTRLNQMIEKLKEENELFRLWWPLYEVKTVTDCHKLKIDPLIGELEFDHVNLQVSDYPDLKLMIYIASSTTEEKLKQKIYSFESK